MIKVGARGVVDQHECWGLAYRGTVIRVGVHSGIGVPL